MKKCFVCGMECSDDAAFCRNCGKAFEGAAQEHQATCPRCGWLIREGAVFCGNCGLSLTGAEIAEPAEDKGDTVRDNYISWRIMPGQLAVKIDEDDIASYGNPRLLRGLYVAPGTKALVYADGRYVATLDSGRYDFSSIEKTADNSEAYDSAAHGFIRNMAECIVDGVKRLFSLRPTLYTILLVKGSEFPLIYEFKGVPTGNLSCDVALHMLCKIGDLEAFLNSLMMEKKFLSTEAFAAGLNQSVSGAVYRTLAKAEAENIDHNPALAAEMLAALQEAVSAVHPYVTVEGIIDVSSSQQDLDHLRQLREDLYVAEQELEQAQLRNDFLNRLQNAEYSNELRNARSRADFEAMMNKVDKDRLLNKDDMDNFVTMLEAERQLRNVRTQTELANAADQLRKSRMLSQAEVDDLMREIKQNAAMKDLENSQLLAMTTLQNQAAFDEEKLKWEIQIGNRRLENEIARQRMQDKYHDERVIAEQDLIQRQQENDMKILKEMEEMKAAREDRRHRYMLDTMQAQQAHETEITMIYAGMTSDQIMAANPNITPEAAAALAEKYKAEAAAAQSVKFNEILGSVIKAKDKEIEDVKASAERQQDRFLAGVQTAVTAGAGAMNRAGVNFQVAPVVPGYVFCTSCGAKNYSDAMQCQACKKTL